MPSPLGILVCSRCEGVGGRTEVVCPHPHCQALGSPMGCRSESEVWVPCESCREGVRLCDDCGEEASVGLSEHGHVMCFDCLRKCRLCDGSGMVPGEFAKGPLCYCPKCEGSGKVEEEGSAAREESRTADTQRRALRRLVQAARRDDTGKTFTRPAQQKEGAR